MKRGYKNKKLALGLLMILVLGFIVTQTSLGSLLISSPWWVYFVLAGIVASGYLAVKYTLEDHESEQEWIEQEGNVYMERLEKERQQRHVERS
ncbi:sporulation YhaL family protein [Bacillus suaedae]|uniref:Sporulation YhaL family protein n=1 Tax=Halalkalibacter suaedae TaxID=2822140 RepID=A0A940WTG4_9BACI|nr:sporulation YhaL family protein [Bacillus suaedae]MBP3951458.1 sporulation YhaL family protein [Bacillus suaedae]